VALRIALAPGVLRLGGTDDKIVQYWLPHADGSATDPPPACQSGSTATNLCLNASRWAGARTTSLLHHFNAKNNIVCQDRLGTNVGKAEREGSFYAAINEFAEATGLRLVFGLSLNATQNARLIDHSHRRSEIQKNTTLFSFLSSFVSAGRPNRSFVKIGLGHRHEEIKPKTAPFFSDFLFFLLSNYSSIFAYEIPEEFTPGWHGYPGSDGHWSGYNETYDCDWDCCE
jgi:hypothetical protein